MAAILGIITARGGSKGIPDKNIRACAGKPLIGWTIEAAHGSTRLTDIILSTDSRKIADVAESFNLTTPDLRPGDLAADHTKSIDTVRYELEKFEKDSGRRIDAVMILQPTAPMRKAKDIDAAIEIFLRENAESLISVCDGGHVHPSTMYKGQEAILTPLFPIHSAIRRQDMDRIYLRNGAIYISTRKQIMEENRILCDAPCFYEMPRERSVNIDEMFDLELADWLLRKERDENPQS